MNESTSGLPAGQIQQLPKHPIEKLAADSRLLKVVTRPSNREELARFEHDRMPLLEAPLFSAAPIDICEAEPAQGELF